MKHSCSRLCRLRWLLLAACALALRFPALAAHGEVTMPRQNPSTFTPQQWTKVFTTTVELPLSQRIALWAGLVAIDSTYVGDPLGEGPGNTPDAGPLCDFAHVDCVTYVEHVYAMALSTSREQFDDTLRRIRYRDGQVDYRWRNHYTVSDWLPANAWFMRDITDEVGAGVTKTMTKTISRGKFFADKGLTQYAKVPDEQATATYIPRGQVKGIAGKLKTGDMVIFVVSTPSIIAGHVGLVRVTSNGVFVQHASLSKKMVITSNLVDYVHDIPERFVGIKVARPREVAVQRN
ncbi:MAG: N-acetylmuramoyl-L-alanine amidase-like domain-containing protein [Armatimonadota bacterium]